MGCRERGRMIKMGEFNKKKKHRLKKRGKIRKVRTR